jgi:hypothetical protein
MDLQPDQACTVFIEPGPFPLHGVPQTQFIIVRIVGNCLA